MRDLMFFALGHLAGAVVTPWLRRRKWFDAATTRLARQIDRIAPVKAPTDGMQAARKGFSLECNPYPKHMPDHSIWRDDWLDFHGRRQ